MGMTILQKIALFWRVPFIREFFVIDKPILKILLKNKRPQLNRLRPILLNLHEFDPKRIQAFFSFFNLIFKTY